MFESSYNTLALSCSWTSFPCATEQLHQLPLQVLLYKFSMDLGCWSTLHTPQGGAILRLINFESWRDCNLVSQTLRKLQRRKEHLELLSSLHVAFLFSPCQHIASLLLAKGSLTWWLQCKRTVFITAQENAANLQITSHYLLYIHLFSPGQNQ